MGISNLLPRILPYAGRKNYDLRSLKDGLISLSPAKDHSRSSSCKRKRSHSAPPSPSCHFKSNDRTKWTRRRVRLAIDLNGWISRACHGHGGSLLDERHLSYYGRANLRRENNADALSAGDDEQVAIRQQQRLDFISNTTQFILKRILFLTAECNTQVLLVLDGATPPAKYQTVADRRNRRRIAEEERDGAPLRRRRQQQQDDEDDSMRNEAILTEREALSRITASKKAGPGTDPDLRRALYSRLFEEFKSNSLPYLISPYESDGQLAYLANSGMVDAVITEDSDLICLGVERLIYKFGQNDINESDGERQGYVGTLLCRSDLGSSELDLIDFSDAMLVVTFVAAGCDYCNSLKGIGIVTARDVVQKAFFTRDPSVPFLRRVLNRLYQSCHLEARNELLPLDSSETALARAAYERAFLGAVALCRHPIVYDPRLGDIIANDVSTDEDGSAARGPASSSFLREEELLMEYEPYRKIVTNREALYRIVGRPNPVDIASKLARGLIDRRSVVAPVNQGGRLYSNYTEAVQANAPGDLQARVPQFSTQPEQGTASETSTDYVLQPSSQEEIQANAAIDLQCIRPHQDTQPTQGATSETSVDYDLQPSSQEFSFICAGTQQSKSSSANTGGNISSLSPDLLASPSPGKQQLSPSSE